MKSGQFSARACQELWNQCSENGEEPLSWVGLRGVTYFCRVASELGSHPTASESLPPGHAAAALQRGAPTDSANSRHAAALIRDIVPPWCQRSRQL
jgi:hypothetical protein